jgi:arabinofuranan 3-O-arabinosyltransferase
MTTIIRPPADQTVAPAPPADTGPVAAGSSVVRRLHLLAVSVALTVLTFVQAPGLIAPDTKADLSIDPIKFLLRAGHLWEPQGDSGQLQNQAYGYFLPMGPFYSVGHLLGLPAWVVQRAWWALVLLVAFHGMYRLCGRFGVGDHPIRIIASWMRLALQDGQRPGLARRSGPNSKPQALQRAGRISMRSPRAAAERSMCCRSSSTSPRRRPSSRASDETDRGSWLRSSWRCRRSVMVSGASPASRSNKSGRCGSRVRTPRCRGGRRR